MSKPLSAPVWPTLFAASASIGMGIQAQLIHTLRKALLAGRLPHGSRLPASRMLAKDLAISRSSVEAAYAQLEAEGYLHRRTGAGSFVAFTPQLRPSKKAASASAQLSQRGQGIVNAGGCRDSALPSMAFNAGQPDTRAFPHALWQKLMQQRWGKSGAALASYGPAQGLPELQSAIAGYLAQARGVDCQPEQILILNSSQQALQMIAQLLIDPADTVWLEDPGYLGARNAMLAAGAQIVPVPVDEEGFNTGISQTLAAPRLIYTTPSHQYPLGIAMSLPRRMALIAQAAAHQAWIIEDDYDSEFYYDQRPLPALQGLDQQGRVIYVGTFSKVLFPSLRLAYVVLPPALVPAFTTARIAFDGHSAQFLQAVTADFISQGHFAAHLRHMRLLYRSRRDLLLEKLQPISDITHPINTAAGLQFALQLPKGLEKPWTASGTTAGLALRPLSAFYQEEAKTEGWLMGYASLSNGQIIRACEALIKSYQEK
ncbi:PLP-dependent aminotransferase family protein [Iodobacter sp. HSC-16F04]|uniref:Putative 8-amino-7-oxononanoate synthase n=1 Tax=Iodobacter violaceini TaxID=3044271 RepID=A0ABX0L1L0_9NEIS|nr:PLP-dependent aminotransferase family protein [Iodobacter violacea]NHQ88407.1 PLP-dependent aminotransferase family protein [Iodobacter violacea]